MVSILILYNINYNFQYKKQYDETKTQLSMNGFDVNLFPTNPTQK